MRLDPPQTALDPLRPAQAVSAAPASSGRSALRRRLLWAGGLAALALLLVLTPPLVNANRYRNKIAQSMSGSLGRPVHLDNVSLHLLPVPGFTLRNLVVSEDPDFGAEPTIRANTVEATLRVTSLWQRPVEFSTVRFVEPSVNLVRNAEGRWNLSEVLLHASRVQSAPTDQPKAGPAPRFPYIEATGGRVNVKLGSEKLPFSLTDADFALWLPSSEQWRVRLVGHPARTDSNITDPGTVRLEGELQRAVTAAAVPVSFRASWHDAPLGEATRILAGDDWGWRGAFNLDATLEGTLGNARLGTKLTLGGLRRAEFFPAQPLDLQITCGSVFALHPASLSQLQCQLPDGAPKPLVLAAEPVHLQHPSAARFTLDGERIPARWALLWAALFSARVPTDLHPTGTVEVHLAHSPFPGRNGAGTAAGTAAGPGLASAAQEHGASGGRSRTGRRRSPLPQGPALAAPWSGTVTVKLPESAPGAEPGLSARAGQTLTWGVIPPAVPGQWPSLHLQPTPLALGPGALVTLAATLGETGYSVTVNGSAPAAALLDPARFLPQLGDGLEKVLPYPPTGLQPARVQFSCTRSSWTTAQTCTGPEPAAAASRSVPGVVPAIVSQRPRSGPALTPASPLPRRNLSPLENAPFSTPRPLSIPPQPR